MYFKLNMIWSSKKKEKQKLFKFLQPNYRSAGENRDDKSNKHAFNNRKKLPALSIFFYK